MGTIVAVQSGPDLECLERDRRPMIYQVDDGTAVIKVTQFVQDKVLEQGEFLLADKSSVMLQKVNETCIIKGPLEVGVTVEVKGMPQIYKDHTEIRAFRMRKVTDPNDEVDRMLLVDSLRKSEVYSSSFQSI